MTEAVQHLALLPAALIALAHLRIGPFGELSGLPTMVFARAGAVATTAVAVRVDDTSVLIFDRYQSGIDHSLIDLESGMVNWYLRIPLSSLILLSSSGAVFSRDPLHRTAPMLWKT